MKIALEEKRAARFFLDVERNELGRRIDARFDAMLAQGALQEVERLAARHLNPALPAMKAHGVPWLLRHLRGEIGLEEAAGSGKRDTRRYTKRQVTWFRNQMPDWAWVNPTNTAETVLRALGKYGGATPRPNKSPNK